jgi:hypothetical protein
MKKARIISALAMIVLLAGVVSAQAHDTTVTGRRVQVDEHVVELGLNGAVKVGIVNQGFDAFLAYIAGPDADGQEIILDAAYRKGSDCAGAGCVFFLTNPSSSVTATELTVYAAKLRGTGTAFIRHCAPADPSC